MRWLVRASALAVCGTAVAAIWYWNRVTVAVTPAVEPASAAVQGEFDRVQISPRARRNLQVASAAIRPQSFWKPLEIPGEIVDRPGVSDRGVVAPVTGVITQIHRFAGDLVHPGETLITLRVLSEPMQLAQTELLKATREIEITKAMKKRLVEVAQSGGIPQIRITELDNTLRRLEVTEQAYRLELQTRGLTPEQIDDVAAGRFLTETRVQLNHPGSAHEGGAPDTDVFEVQALKVELGQQVQAGQLLCLLAHHQVLDIEGRAFRHELPLVEQSLREHWEVRAEFVDDDPRRWPDGPATFHIRHISNTIDAASRTFAFYLPLANQSQTYDNQAQTRVLWRYRPGQRVRLYLKSEQLDNVCVLPAGAVVSDGGQSFVFRRSGDWFERKAVRVVHRDRTQAVIEPGAELPPGVHVATSGAAEINRTLLARRGSGTSTAHAHADGTVHEH